jgi:hypothetical protein
MLAVKPNDQLKQCVLFSSAKGIKTSGGIKPFLGESSE